MAGSLDVPEDGKDLRLRPTPGATRAELSHDGKVWLLAWHGPHGAAIDPAFDNATLSGALKQDVSPESVVPYVQRRIAACGFSPTRAASVPAGVVAAWDLQGTPA